MLHRPVVARNAPSRRRNSGGASKIGMAKFSHPIKNTEANLGLCFLISKVARLELGPDDGLPTADPPPSHACVACMRGCVQIRLRCL
jgi:hypothetical protein